jgi:predicted TIM-barrel enzyme
MDVFLDQLKALGFAGVQNFPTVGLIDGTFRANLEETGMSYALEVEMIAKARAKDMLTTPYVFNAADAKAMAEAGADIVVCHLGLTTGGAIGAQTALKLEDCPARIDAWAAAALGVNPEIVVLAHGGPVADRRGGLHRELALSPILQGSVVCAHGLPRRTGGDQRRRLRAAFHS